MPRYKFNQKHKLNARRKRALERWEKKLTTNPTNVDFVKEQIENLKKKITA